MYNRLFGVFFDGHLLGFPCEHAVRSASAGRTGGARLTFQARNIAMKYHIALWKLQLSYIIANAGAAPWCRLVSMRRNPAA